MLNEKVSDRFDKHFGKNAQRGKTILAMDEVNFKEFLDQELSKRDEETRKTRKRV